MNKNIQHRIDKILLWEEKAVFPLIRIQSPFAFNEINQKEAQAFIQKLCENENIRYITVIVNTSIKEPTYDIKTRTLSLPNEYSRKIILLSRFVAISCPKSMMGGQYLRTYINLIDKYFGVKKEALLIQLKKFEIKV